MAHQLDLGAVQGLLTALCGSYEVELDADHRVRLLNRSLPAEAVCSILPDIGDGILRVVYDLGKPHAFLHAQAMIRLWWESSRQPVAFPDGTVEMLKLPSPRPGAGPVRVALLAETN